MAPTRLHGYMVHPMASRAPAGASLVNVYKKKRWLKIHHVEWENMGTSTKFDDVYDSMAISIAMLVYQRVIFESPKKNIGKSTISMAMLVITRG